MKRISALRLLVLGLLLAPLACFSRYDPGRIEPGNQNAGRRAALARVSVQNETDGTLRIAFRAAAPEGPEIIVGSVAPVSKVTMAPIPAGEPIILSATREDGATLLLAPRSFALDGEWTWVIPQSARFQASTGGTP